MGVSEIKELIQRGNYYQALEAIDDLSPSDRLNGLILKSRIFEQKGEVEKSHIIAEQALETSTNLGEELQQLQAQICHGYGFLTLQKLTMLEETIERGEALLLALSNESTLDLKESEADLKYLKGFLFFMKIERDVAQDFLNESLTIRKEIIDQQGIIESYTALGMLYLLLFKKPVTAIDNFKRAMSVMEKLGNKTILTYSLRQIMSYDEVIILISVPEDQQSFIPDRARNICPEVWKIQNEFQQKLSQKLLRVPSEQKKEFLLALDSYQKYNALFNVFATNSPLYQDVGWHLHVKGDLVRALHYYKKSLELLKNIEENKPETGRLLSTLGTIYADLGKLDLALEYFKSSLNLNREIDYKIAIAYSLKEISKIYSLKGELDLAMDYINESFNLFSMSDWRDGLNRCYLVLGVIWKHMGKLDLARSFLRKGWELRNQFGGVFPLLDSYYLYHLILLAQALNDVDEAAHYLKQLQKIQQSHESKTIILRYHFCEAIVLKMSNRTIDKFLAQQKFREILEKHTERLLSTNPIFIMVMLNLCELLMLELKVSSNQEEIFQEISTLIGICRLQAEYFNLMPLLVSSFIIESRLNLVKNDLKQAQILLNKALIIAEEKKLGNLIVKVKKEKKTLDLNGRGSRKGLSIQERIKHANLEEYFNEAKKLPEAWVQSTTMQPFPEDPVMFVIVADGDLTLFTRVFDQYYSKKIGLIGQILVAYEKFSKEVFSSSAEHVTIGDLRLVMQTRVNLRFAYAFRGESYPAISKLIQLMDKLQSKNDLWEKLENMVNTGIALSSGEEAEINGTLNDIILSTNADNTGWFHSPYLKYTEEARQLVETWDRK
ncbi:MAG: tetratricopeptide repeat protein [Candidatus Hodarchaeales archaeon]